GSPELIGQCEVVAVPVGRDGDPGPSRSGRGGGGLPIARAETEPVLRTVRRIGGEADYALEAPLVHALELSGDRDRVADPGDRETGLPHPGRGADVEIGVPGVRRGSRGALPVLVGAAGVRVPAEGPAHVR